jgi:hypothetical protein
MFERFEDVIIRRAPIRGDLRELFRRVIVGAP